MGRSGSSRTVDHCSLLSRDSRDIGTAECRRGRSLLVFKFGTYEVDTMINLLKQITLMAPYLKDIHTLRCSFLLR